MWFACGRVGPDFAWGLQRWLLYSPWCPCGWEHLGGLPPSQVMFVIGSSQVGVVGDSLTGVRVLSVGTYLPPVGWVLHFSPHSLSLPVWSPSLASRAPGLLTWWLSSTKGARQKRLSERIGSDMKVVRTDLFSENSCSREESPAWTGLHLTATKARHVEGWGALGEGCWRVHEGQSLWLSPCVF